ncbi:unnamed protein product, partial [Didymodactylos carnosus]
KSTSLARAARLLEEKKSDSDEKDVSDEDDGDFFYGEKNSTSARTIAATTTVDEIDDDELSRIASMYENEQQQEQPSIVQKLIDFNDVQAPLKERKTLLENDNMDDDELCNAFDKYNEEIDSETRRNCLEYLDSLLNDDDDDDDEQENKSESMDNGCDTKSKQRNVTMSPVFLNKKN